MRRGIYPSLLLVVLYLVVPAALANDEDPLWVVVSTEVDEFLDGSGFMDRQGLKLDYATGWTWPGSVFFDPGPGVLGVETGLDAFHYDLLDGLCFFSIEVDINTAQYTFEDEDLLAYDPTTGLVTEVFDVKNLLAPTGAPLGLDYGLDAICYVEDDPQLGSFWAFSSEVDIAPLGVTAGDLVFTDGVNITGTLLLQQEFDHEVGCDALHMLFREEDGRLTYEVIMSTEVDGSVFDPYSQQWLSFKDEDIVTLVFDLGNNLIEATIPPWTGIAAFGRDVGLDALYLGPPIPEPATILLVGLGFGALALRFRNKR